MRSPTLLPGFPPLDRPRVFGRPNGARFQIAPEHAEGVLEALRAHPRAWVSCQEHDRLALNENYDNQVTPQAVYGFPRAYFAHLVWWWSFRRDVYPVTGVEYAHRRRLFLFDLEGRAVDSACYADAAPDVDRLGERWSGPCPAAAQETLGFAVDASAVAAKAENWSRSIRKHREAPPERQVEFLLRASEAIVDGMLPDGGGRSIGGFWSHPRKPALWRHLIADLGYAAVVDRHAALTGDIGQQVAVLCPEAIRAVVEISNPVARPRETASPRR